MHFEVAEGLARVLDERVQRRRIGDALLIEVLVDGLVQTFHVAAVERGVGGRHRDATVLDLEVDLLSVGVGRELDRSEADLAGVARPRHRILGGCDRDVTGEIVELALGIGDEQRRVPLQRFRLVRIEAGDHLFDVELFDRGQHVVHCTLWRRRTRRRDALFGNVLATAQLVGRRVEQADVPATVAFDRSERQIELRVVLVRVEVRTLAVERLIDEEVADRNGLAVDDDLRSARDRHPRNVADVGLSDRDLLVRDRDVDATDLVQIGGFVGDLEPRQFVDEIDHRLAERLPFAWHQKIDCAEHIFAGERDDQLVAQLLGTRRATVGVVAAQLGDGERGGPEYGNNAGHRTDHLGPAATRRSLHRRQHHRGARRIPGRPGCRRLLCRRVYRFRRRAERGRNKRRGRRRLRIVERIAHCPLPRSLVTAPES